MGMENNLKYTVVFPKIGQTEDDHSNFLIACFEMMKGKCPGSESRPFQYFEGATMEVKENPLPVSITITIKDQGLI